MSGLRIVNGSRGAGEQMVETGNPYQSPQTDLESSDPSCGVQPSGSMGHAIRRGLATFVVAFVLCIPIWHFGAMMIWKVYWLGWTFLLLGYGLPVLLGLYVARRTYRSHRPE
ncbi:MAG: hypothetical protein ACOY3P_16790 [Planctomycetota bacterium]